MSDNIYAAPEANLQVEPAEKGEATFYVVSEAKFLTLFISTFGLYAIYWFYKNWNNYRHSSGEKLWPVPRGIFSIFFVHSLFRHVAKKNEDQQQTTDWNCESQASIVVILLIARNILDRLAQKSVGSPITDIFLIVLIFPLAFCLMSAQSAINLACNDPKGRTNAKLSIANYIWIAIGIILWILILIGMFAEIQT